MPRPVQGANELDQLAAPPDQEVRGDAKRLQSGHPRIGRGLQPIEEQPLDGVTRKHAGRQTDVVNQQAVDRHARWALIKIGRLEPAGLLNPARPFCTPAQTAGAHGLRVAASRCAALQ